METIKIKIYPINLKNQRPTEVRESFVELNGSYLRFRMDFLADEPTDTEDSGMPWADGVQNNYDIIAMKKNISGIEKSLTADKKWAVYVMVDGFSNDIKCYFKTQFAAEQYFEQVKNWLINGN